MMQAAAHHIEEQGKILLDLKALVQKMSGENGYVEYKTSEGDPIRGWDLYTKRGVTSVQRAECPKGVLEGHTHSEIEVIVLLEGDATYKDGSRTRRMKPGDVVRIPPGTPHGFTMHVDSQMIGIAIPDSESYPHADRRD